MNATSDILDFAAATHILPEAVRSDGLRLLGDTLAVGAAGAASPEAQKLLRALSGWGQGGTARLFSGARVPTPSAAFFNGFAVHCLEWDAVHEVAVVHALSVVTAALLAASDRMDGCDPDAFLVALCVGVDIASGLGIAATGPMRFFRPATCGVIGAALAVARLECLPREQFADVLGLAYSFAAGTMQAHVEASIALPLQIANAARSAITAVDLVKAGLNGPQDALEGPFGYAALLEPLDLARYTADLGTIWRISEVATKPFPSGRASHAALGALMHLRDEHGVEFAQVKAIELHAPPLIQRLVGRPYRTDMTPGYARLCLPLLAPMMLRDGAIDPALFGTDALFARELAQLAENVSVKVDSNPDLNAMSPQKIVVTLTSGERLERNISFTLGSIEAPISPPQLKQKYDLCRRSAATADPRLFDDPLVYATEPA